MSGVPASPGGGDGGRSHESGENSSHSNLREQDQFLPIANIGRIMKKMLPENGKVAKDARETVQECTSEFIGFITSQAVEKCKTEKRKTITGDDLIWALATLGFEDYVDPLRTYLDKYRGGIILMFIREFLLYTHRVLRRRWSLWDSAMGVDSSATGDVQLLPNPNAQKEIVACFDEIKDSAMGDYSSATGDVLFLLNPNDQKEIVACFDEIKDSALGDYSSATGDVLFLPNPNAQLVHQDPFFPQGVDYPNSQVCFDGIKDSAIGDDSSATATGDVLLLPNPNAQLVHQDSFLLQGVDYPNSQAQVQAQPQPQVQAQPQHMMFPRMQGWGKSRY